MSTEILSLNIQAQNQRSKRQYNKRTRLQRANELELEAKRLREEDRKERISHLIELGAALVAGLRGQDAAYIDGAIENLLLFPPVAAGKAQKKRLAAVDWLRAEVAAG